MSGFNPRNVLLFRVNPTLNRYDAGKRRCSTNRSANASARFPACVSVSWSNTSLMSGRRFSTGGMFVQGRTYPRGQRDVISGVSVSPTFFETMEIPLVAGRGFTRTRQAGRAARRRDQRGRRPQVLSRTSRRSAAASAATLEGSGSVEIVGILRDAKYNGVRDAAVPTKYTPFAQGFQGTAPSRCGRPAIRSHGGRRCGTPSDRSIPPCRSRT